MDERTLHRLRNDLNVVGVGLSLLRRQLEAEASAETLDTLDRVEQAFERCALAVALQQHGPGR
ncbi:hypothetical protein [Stenotrophomonas sp. PS02297]|uniref:hypothetical protein n=1 Tax=Stenotrophomonas sp. PS02297 TaxID=2991423 RepID=UPI00249BEC8F|nr:hypothetical protein [Stenotrophomonas sp. PS02297]